MKLTGTFLLCSLQSIWLVGMKFLVGHQLDFSIFSDINKLCLQKGLIMKLREQSIALVTACDFWGVESIVNKSTRWNTFLELGVLLGGIRCLLWIPSTPLHVDSI